MVVRAGLCRYARLVQQAHRRRDFYRLDFLRTRCRGHLSHPPRLARQAHSLPRSRLSLDTSSSSSPRRLLLATLFFSPSVTPTNSTISSPPSSSCSSASPPISFGANAPVPKSVAPSSHFIVWVNCGVEV